MTLPAGLEPLPKAFYGGSSTTKYLQYASQDELAKLSGKRSLVSGGNVGVGYETALALVKAGCHVTLACRNLAKAEVAAASLREQAATGVEIDILPIDFESLASIRRFAELWKAKGHALDVLIQNAGIIPSSRVTTEDGIESGLQINCVAPLLLVVLLLPTLARAESPRIVVVASDAAYKMDTSAVFDNMQMEDYPQDWGRFPFRALRGFTSYGRAKFWLMAGVASLVDRLRGSRDVEVQKIVCTMAHPGFTATDAQRKADYGMPLWFLAILGRLSTWIALSPKTGAQTVLWLAEADEPGKAIYNGSFWASCKQFALPARCYDTQFKAKTWTKLCELASLPEDCVA